MKYYNNEEKILQRIPFYQCLDVLWLSVIFTLPFDASPLVPVDGVIRPLSLYFIVLYYLIIKFCYYKISKFELRSIFLLVFLNVFTLFLALYKYDNLNGFYKFFLGSFVLLMIITVTYDYIKRKLVYCSVDELWHKTTKIFVISSVLPLIVGVIQVFGKYSSHEIYSNYATLFFVYKTTSRIQFVSGEPAWAAIYFNILISLVYFYLRHRTLKWALILIYFSALLFTGSSFGILTLLLGALLYQLMYKRLNLAKLLYFFLVTIIIGASVYSFIPAYTKSRLTNIYKIFDQSDSEAIMNYAKKDESFFLRIFNPAIAIQTLPKTFFMGTGGEYYYHYYPSIVLENYQFAKEFDQVKPILNGEVRTTPKNIYAKFVSEFGIFGLIFLSIFLLTIIKVVKSNLRKGENGGLAFLMCIILASFMNMDSYHYPLLMVPFFTIIFSNKIDHERKKYERGF